MRDPEISAVLDPRWTIEEVVQTWTSLLGDWLFIPGQERGTKDEAARLWTPRADAAPLDWIGSIERGETYEALHLPLGILPRLRSGNVPVAVEAFETPSLPDATTEVPEPTALAWYRTAPVKLHLSRCATGEHRYFCFTVALAEGTQGLRESLLRALVHVLSADREALGPWPAGEALMAELKQAQAGIQAWESQIDHDGLQNALEAVTAQVIERFGVAGKASVLSSDPAPGSPVDLTVARPTGARAAFGRPSFEEMVCDLWASRLSWDGFGRERATSYWTRHREGPAWDALWNACSRGMKGTWPTLVEIITAQPFDERFFDDLVTFLLDPNWPGCGEAWDFILKLGERGLHLLDGFIEQQNKAGFTSWERELAPWREMLVDELAKK